METPTKVHCFFEQSGTFKNEFRKIGIPAEDYDIQNNFGETDHVIDLFAEIERGYDGKPSVFDGIGGGDLIMAFFPCIYFSQMSQYAQSLNYTYHTGDCSLGRSMISPDYARNFIADFILGKPLGGRPQQQDLFATQGETQCA